MKGSGKLDEAMFYFLVGNVVKDAYLNFKKSLNYFSEACFSAFDCVITAPFSRRISKKCHNSYINNKQLFLDELRKYRV